MIPSRICVGDTLVYRRTCVMACGPTSGPDEWQIVRVIQDPTRRSSGTRCGCQWSVRVEYEKNGGARRSSFHSGNLHMLGSDYQAQSYTVQFQSEMSTSDGSEMFSVEAQERKAGWVGVVRNTRDASILWESDPQSDDKDDKGLTVKSAAAKATEAADDAINSRIAELFTTP